ncbi:MAG: PA0069 family radical SAM protein [Ignavibacteriaceae bacterium]
MHNTLKGRGAKLNPKNRFEKLTISYDENTDEVFEDENFPERKIPTIFFKDNSKTIIAVNDSDDLGFNYSINPYRGCEHGCIYCYARPSHEYLGFSSGIDFETKIMVKEDAPQLLEKTFQKKSYKPDVIVLSGNTDCYQPVERKLKITRGILKTCLDYRHPISVITKNGLVLRDIDILQELAALNLTTVTISITTLNKELTSNMEPRTATPQLRLKTVEELVKNNIPAGVNVAPIIPGLNDEEIPAILKEASLRGASYAGHIIVRLPYANKDLFVDWLNKQYPGKAGKILNRIRDVRGGKLSSAEWGKRFSGEGEIAEAIHKLFKISCKKYGLNKPRFDLTTDLFRRKTSEQIELFN